MPLNHPALFLFTSFQAKVEYVWCAPAWKSRKKIDQNPLGPHT
jgi:hypothetical protein